MTRKVSYILSFTIISIVLLLLAVTDMNVGSFKISASDIWNYFFNKDLLSDAVRNTIQEFRIPRVVTAIIAGAALSISGLLMQTMFRNPLAGPYVLGISNGASLGVAIVVLGLGSLVSSQALMSGIIIPLAAGIGAALVLLLVLAVSFRVKDSLSILIVGILISGVVASVVSIMQFFASEVAVKYYVVWTMGSIDAVSLSDTMIMLPVIVVMSAIMYAFSKPLNIFLLGENFACGMGVNVKTLRIAVFAGVSVLTGIVTAYCGPLGFIGLAVPHIARWIFNSSNHFVLFPATILLGASFLLCGDILSHVIYSGGVLPINAVISILGAPFIIWVVMKNQRTII